MPDNTVQSVEDALAPPPVPDAPSATAEDTPPLVTKVLLGPDGEAYGLGHTTPTPLPEGTTYDWPEGYTPPSEPTEPPVDPPVDPPVEPPTDGGNGGDEQTPTKAAISKTKKD